MAIYKDIENFPKLFDEEYKKTRELIGQGESHLDNLAEGFLEADRVLRKLPIADVVEVVRCKDCEYCEVLEMDYGEKQYWCKFWNTPKREYADAFCCHGKPKEKA